MNPNMALAAATHVIFFGQKGIVVKKCLKRLQPIQQYYPKEATDTKVALHLFSGERNIFFQRKQSPDQDNTCYCLKISINKSINKDINIFHKIPSLNPDIPYSNRIFIETLNLGGKNIFLECKKETRNDAFPHSISV